MHYCPSDTFLCRPAALRAPSHPPSSRILSGFKRRGTLRSHPTKRSTWRERSTRCGRPQSRAVRLGPRAGSRDSTPLCTSDRSRARRTGGWGPDMLRVCSARTGVPCAQGAIACAHPATLKARPPAPWPRPRPRVDLGPRRAPSGPCSPIWMPHAPLPHGAHKRALHHEPPGLGSDLCERLSQVEPSASALWLYDLRVKPYSTTLSRVNGGRHEGDRGQARQRARLQEACRRVPRARKDRPRAWTAESRGSQQMAAINWGRARPRRPHAIPRAPLTDGGPR